MSPMVGVVILTYANDASMLESCIRSVLRSDGPLLLDVVVVDNASPSPVAGLVAERLRAAFPGVHLRVVMLPNNTGFAGGINRGIAALDPNCTEVFLLNPDATVETSTIAALHNTLAAADPNVLSVAPKMLLSGFDRVIDAIGNAVNARGEAANIGLGQPDLGQYDGTHEIFGPCFGAALFRREAFYPDRVGELDERLFLYYEDVDWNWRAQILGYRSLAEPAALAHHQMSASSRDRSYDFKFELTERNLLLCVLKNAPWSTVVQVFVTRGAGLVLGSMKGHYPMAGLKALLGVARRAPATILDRRRLQRNRKRPHQEILAYSRGERTFFDAVRYEPTDRAAALAEATRRLAERTPA